MADYVASIVGIATFAVQLSHSLYQVGGRVAGAKLAINRVATNLALFASTLRHVAAVLSSSQSIHSREAEHTVRQITDHCNRLFAEIQDLATPAADLMQRSPHDPRRKLGIFEKIRWSFEQPKVDRLLTQIEYLKSTLCILIQTLTLAIHMSQMPHRDPVAQEQAATEIDQHRQHIETLVYARHLAIMIVREKSDGDRDPLWRSPSPSDSDATVDITPQKSIEPMSPASQELIALGGTLDFLEKAAPHDGQIRRQSISLPSNVVDLLLLHWTTLNPLDATTSPEELSSSPSSTPSPSPPSDESNTPLPVDSPAPSPPRAAIHSLHADHAERTIPSPGSSPTSSNGSSIDSWSHVSSETLTPKATSGPLPSPKFSKRAPEQYAAPTPVQAANIAQPNISKLAKGVNEPETETDDRPHLLSGGLANHKGPPPPKATSNEARPRSPAVTAAAKSRVHARNVASPPLSVGSSNYMSPYISSARSDAMSSADSDHDSFVDYPQRRPSTQKEATRTPSTLRSVQTGSTSPVIILSDAEKEDVGLEIPWRIRISPTRYFEFSDQHPVGTTRNVDSIDSIFEHPEAKTEIDQAWVHIRALQEKNLDFLEVLDFDPERKIKGWRIARALRFAEVEALVDRSIQIIHQQANGANKDNAPRQSRESSSSAYRASTIPQAPPQSQLPYPVEGGPHVVQPLPIPQPNTSHNTRRSVSFHGGPRPDLRSNHAAPFPDAPSSRRPRDLYAPPQTLGPDGASPQDSRLARSLSNTDALDRAPRPRPSDRRYDDRPAAWPSSRPRADRSERELDTGRGSRRSVHRGSLDRERERERERERDRDRDSGAPRDKHRTTAGRKLVRLGGLAALLDGMDTLIL